MTKFLLIIGGMLLCLITFAGWYWLQAFGCGMSTAGCREFPLPWEDTEALPYIIPPFIIGLVMIVGGIALRSSGKK